MKVVLKRMNPEAHSRFFRKNANTVVVVAASERRGEMRLDIRQYWDPDGDGEYVPTKKGVNLSLYEDGPELLSALINVVGEVDDNLLDDIQ